MRVVVADRSDHDHDLGRRPRVDRQGREAEGEQQGGDDGGGDATQRAGLRDEDRSGRATRSRLRSIVGGGRVHGHHWKVPDPPGPIVHPHNGPVSSANGSRLPVRTGADVHLADAFGAPGCPLCRERQRSEDAYLESILAESVNDIPFREALDAARGFCARHVAAVLEADRRRAGTLGAAILLRATLVPRLRELEVANAAKGWSRARRVADAARPPACPACERDARTDAGRAESLVGLTADAAWAVAVAGSPLCLDHLLALMGCGRRPRAGRPSRPGSSNGSAGCATSSTGTPTPRATTAGSSRPTSSARRRSRLRSCSRANDAPGRAPRSRQDRRQAAPGAEPAGRARRPPVGRVRHRQVDRRGRADRSPGWPRRPRRRDRPRLAGLVRGARGLGRARGSARRQRQPGGMRANYLEVGVRSFVLAGTVRSERHVDGIRAALAMPLAVIRLDMPLAVIEARLGGDPTASRADDLRVAASDLETGAAAAMPADWVSTGTGRWPRSWTRCSAGSAGSRISLIPDDRRRRTVGSRHLRSGRPSAHGPEDPVHRIRIAAQLHPQQGAWRELRAAAVASDDLGYDIVYTWDHFFPLYGERDGPHFECWSLLAGMGRRHDPRRARAAGVVHRLPQPAAARRHRPDRRPRQRRAGDPRPRRRLVPARLRRVRLRVRRGRGPADDAVAGRSRTSSAGSGRSTRRPNGGCRS